MKNLLYYISLIYIITSCKSTHIFNDGNIKLEKEKILNINYTKNLPLINVFIEGKEYVFLLDTGAPTVISTEIYDFLNLKPKFTQNVTDSNNKKSKQIFTKIPQMNIQGVDFYDIGCVVLDLNEQEFKCYKIDGIIGANQMAKAKWQFNYQNEIINIYPFETKVDSSYYDFSLNINFKNQKTPLVTSKILGLKRQMTFDTGYTGNIKINLGLDSTKTYSEGVTYYGNSSVGAYGTSKDTILKIFRTDSIEFSSKKIYNEIVQTGNSNLIGNSFFENYQFLIDWKIKKIYFKKIKNKTNQTLHKPFGFSYRFINKKATISLVESNKTYPLKIGDEIIAINDTSFENLKENEVCEKYLNFNLKDLVDILKIKIKRENEYYTYILNKNKEL